MIFVSGSLRFKKNTTESRIHKCRLDLQNFFYPGAYHGTSDKLDFMAYWKRAPLTSAGFHDAFSHVLTEHLDILDGTLHMICLDDMRAFDYVINNDTFRVKELFYHETDSRHPVDWALKEMLKTAISDGKINLLTDSYVVTGKKEAYEACKKIEFLYSGNILGIINFEYFFFNIYPIKRKLKGE